MDKADMKELREAAERAPRWRDVADELPREARGRGGRPAEMAGGRRVNVYLDSASLARAAELGGGNVSEGIRRALSTTGHQESR